MLEMAWNGEKIDRKYFFKFWPTFFLTSVWKNTCQKMEKKKKVDRNCLKWRENWSKMLFEMLTNILPLEFSLAVGSRGSHDRKSFALVAEGNHYQ